MFPPQRLSMTKQKPFIKNYYMKESNSCRKWFTIPFRHSQWPLYFYHFLAWLWSIIIFMIWAMNRISCRFQFCKLTSNYPIYWQMIWIHVSLRSPFNWRTPFGYLLITLIGSVLIFIMLSCAIPSICLTSKYLLSSWWNGTVHSNIIAIFFCIFSCIKCIGSVFPHVDHKQSKCNEWIAT